MVALHIAAETTAPTTKPQMGNPVQCQMTVPEVPIQRVDGDPRLRVIEGHPKTAGEGHPQMVEGALLQMVGEVLLLMAIEVLLPMAEEVHLLMAEGVHLPTAIEALLVAPHLMDIEVLLKVGVAPLQGIDQDTLMIDQDTLRIDQDTLRTGQDTLRTGLDKPVDPAPHQNTQMIGGGRHPRTADPSELLLDLAMLK